MTVISCDSLSGLYRLKGLSYGMRIEGVISTDWICELVPDFINANELIADNHMLNQVVYKDSFFHQVKIIQNEVHRFKSKQLYFINSEPESISVYNALEDSLIGWRKAFSDRKDSILPSGTYRFSVQFAEWKNGIKDEQVTVRIKGDNIMVIYEGDGELIAKSGEILEKGFILMHKSGVWIIANDIEDIAMDEIGGCTGGPTVIDFKNKVYWMC
jgi:hypothetical protein